MIDSVVKPRLILLFLLVFPAAVFAELHISDAWIKNLPASVPVRAGYMTIYNPEDTTVSIIGLRSESFASVEIHQTISRDGMMSMEPVPNLNIEPDTSVQLAPGALHLMMMQPINPGKPGDRIRIVITFDDGSEQSLDMTVKK